MCLSQLATPPVKPKKKRKSIASNRNSKVYLHSEIPKLSMLMLTNNFTGWHCNTNRFTEEKAEESKKSAA
jgi:hypothetical protein